MRLPENECGAFLQSKNLLGQLKPYSCQCVAFGFQVALFYSVCVVFYCLCFCF
ncbi:hypothetical protein EIKCOROL_00937 [Eikenella corrodens ATCC 23834]|uniref:Uncharacterized protein n=1 Tax=Eikenella corrodens ATCC 23834 TaxID=546274 RepID=C0DUA5_EIKCO|nr:hypothetical protein EIKCOROL_00937 [Eikenella corrodens ATCC 23834]